MSPQEVHGQFSTLEIRYWISHPTSVQVDIILCGIDFDNAMKLDKY